MHFSRITRMLTMKMNQTGSPLLLGPASRTRRLGIGSAVVLAALAYALSPAVVAGLGPFMGSWGDYALLPMLFAAAYAYHENGLAVCWLLAGLPTFAAVVRLGLGGWFGPPSLSQLVSAGVLFGVGVALVAGTLGFVLGVGLRVLTREVAS